MDSEFIFSLRSIKTDDPKIILERVFAVFLRISTMDSPTVIAAYQTFNFFLKERRQQDEVTEKRIKQIEDALMTRMQALCAAAPRNERRQIAYVFSSATGEPFDMIHFKGIIND